MKTILKIRHIYKKCSKLPSFNIILIKICNQLSIPAGELGVDELQLEVFDEESICIDGL